MAERVNAVVEQWMQSLNAADQAKQAKLAAAARAHRDPVGRRFAL
jgi:hypothetical protein